jgi:hypothetical protein
MNTENNAAPSGLTNRARRAIESTAETYRINGLPKIADEIEEFLAATPNAAPNGLTREQIAIIQNAANTAHRVLCAGGDPASPRDDSDRPCEWCNGTGDVHSPDGEWRGTCVCAGGIAIDAALQSHSEGEA